jgi:RNase adaptor protein for sRNA GlmZ degradation
MQLRNAEYLQFLLFIIKLVENNAPAVLQLEAQLQALILRYNEFDALFKLPQNNEKTAGLLELDSRRYKSIRGIAAIIEAYTNHHDLIYAAAKYLLRNLQVYRSQIYYPKLSSGIQHYFESD